MFSKHLSIKWFAFQGFRFEERHEIREMRSQVVHRFQAMRFLPILIVTVFILTLCDAHSGRRRRKPRDHSVYYPDSRHPVVSIAKQKILRNHVHRMGIENMTCGFFRQPLNHFELPRHSNWSFPQRYCIYNGFAHDPMGNSTVLFYTGNESPLEQYINNTGLMWELGERLSAQIVFVEHRYEGKSRPSPSVPNCMAYSSSIQALADYANFIDQHLFRIQRRPVITFGGSYGGMLSAWMRMKYPNIIAGAVAASAPVWGFPRNFPRNIDSAWQVVQHGLKQQYPPTDPVKGENNFCSDNLLATWPLVHVLAEIEAGRDLLTKSFRLCEPLRASEGNGQTLIDWAQSPWFDFAEGSFPYPSSYIPYALTHNENAKLPAWPLQAACWVNSSLHQNLGVVFDGNISNVQYEISYATDGTIAIDWDQTRVSPEDRQRLAESPVVAKLLSNVRDAVSVWFNVTHDVACYNLTAAPNRDSKDRWIDAKTFRKLYSPRPDPSMLCSAELEKGSWPALCCNEVMNLIITDASGLGRDFLWPPSHPRGTSTYADTIISRNRTTVDDFCQDPEGVFGYSQEPPDPWATWYDVYYGGIHIESHSNIVFSNGLLDPWSAAGVYAMDAVHPFDTPRKTRMERSEEIIPGLYVQNISQSGNMVAVIMEYGGHHTDLMYSSDNDPPSITKAREVEESYIRLWINEWWNQSFQCAASKK